MMGAPISSSRSRMGVWPPRAAKWRAVAPSLSRAVRPMSVKVTWRKGGEGPGEAGWGDHSWGWPPGGGHGALGGRGPGHHSPGSPGTELAPHTQPVIIPAPGTSRTVFGG